MTFSSALVVDNDPDFGRVASDLLRSAGAETVTVTRTSAEALTLVGAGAGPGADSPAVILCDLDKSMHEGVFLIRSLAERGFAGRIIVISAGSDPVAGAMTQLARHQGLNILGTLRKPLRFDDLQFLLTGASPRPAPAPASPAMPSLLEAAISQGGLHPFFQPKVRMRDGRISGAEALARIATPEAPYSSPGPYVALAERNSRIDALTFAMTCAVARHATGFLLDGQPLPVSINISPVSLERPDFPDVMAGAVEAQGLSCRLVTLEVTDTRPGAYGAQARDVMARLRAHGFGLSIDDFGAGHASIDRLRDYPFSEVKIDAQLTRHALQEEFARDCLESSVRLAHDLGITVVAEGVETVDMWDLLESLNVEEAQGFLLSKPLPPSGLVVLLGQPDLLGARNAAMVRARSA